MNETFCYHYFASLLAQLKHLERLAQLSENWKPSLAHLLRIILDEPFRANLSDDLGYPEGLLLKKAIAVRGCMEE